MARVRYAGMRSSIVIIAALYAAIAAPAAAARRSVPAGERVTVNIAVYGNDPCPKGNGDEIVVCARLPESERYRIPKSLRESRTARRDQSWVARVRDIEETGRDQRPNSCSAVGSGGQTGCFQKFMRDAEAQRRVDGNP